MVQDKTILGVLRINDKDGIIDDYIWCLLRFLKEYAQDVAVVCTAIEESNIPGLLSYTDKLYTKKLYTKNSGIRDVAYKRYDEVWLLLDNCFGPLYSEEDFLEELKDCTVDFIEVVPSHFIMINHADIISDQDWAGILDGSLGIEGLTDKLYREKRRGGVLGEPEEGINPVPVFLDKNIFLGVDLNLSSGEIPRRTLEYIKEYTRFDVDLIWAHLLRICNIQELKDALHLEYIFPWKYFNGDEEEAASHKTALIAHLHYEDMVDECVWYLRQVPEWVDLYITTGSRATWDKIQGIVKQWGRQRCFVRFKENRGRDVSSLLVACHDILLDYEYLGFVHDKKSGHSLSVKSASGAFQYNVWENIVKSDMYLYHIFQCFRENPRLGLLVPPEPYYASLLGCLGDSWGTCFEPAKGLTDLLKLNVNIGEDRNPFTLSTTFWCRTKAMMKLFAYRFEYTDFPAEPMAADGTFSHAVERILGYVAQSEGYYTAVVMNEGYASLRGNCLQMLLVSALNEIRKETTVLRPDDITDYQKRKERILLFCRRYPQVYIYGAGTYGHKCGKLLCGLGIRPVGYVVSDGHRRKPLMEGMPVYELSEIMEQKQTCGIILALNPGNQKAVEKQMDEQGFRNWISVMEGIS